MTIEHKDISEERLHESKGVSTAGVGEVYITDGVGSGAFVKSASAGLISAGAGKLIETQAGGAVLYKEPYLQGFEYHSDTGTPQALTSGVFVELTNDGAGTNTNNTYKLPDGRADLWDTSLNQFDWSILSLGDTVDIRFDLAVVTSADDGVLTLAIDLAHGDASEDQLVVMEQHLKTTGTHQLSYVTSVCMANTGILNNPTKVVMKSDSASNTVIVKGWSARTLPRRLVMV